MLERRHAWEEGSSQSDFVISSFRFSNLPNPLRDFTSCLANEFGDIGIVERAKALGIAQQRYAAQDSILFIKNSRCYADQPGVQLARCKAVSLFPDIEHDFRKCLPVAAQALHGGFLLVFIINAAQLPGRQVG